MFVKISNLKHEQYQVIFAFLGAMNDEMCGCCMSRYSSETQENLCLDTAKRLPHAVMLTRIPHALSPSLHLCFPTNSLVKRQNCVSC